VQRALVKATSFTSEIGADLMPPGSRALLLYAAPRSYIENILAGEASRRELAMLTPSRADRLSRRAGGRWQAETIGEQAALAWACETSSLAALAQAIGEERVLWCDFDRFLAAPAPELARIAAFFGQSLSDADAEALVDGPLMHRYSKDLSYEYSPELRREVLEESRAENAAEIAAAMRWLKRAGTASPAISACLARAAA
jgi:hypothetical protein